MNTTKIVFIGAGSFIFGLNLFRDIFTSQVLHGSTLVLVDTNRENLATMTNLARQMNRERGAGLTIESTTDRRAALPGAQFVLNSVAIERNRLWKLDFSIPKKYGFRQTLGENGGPGGLFFTLRTLPLIMDIARDMEEFCPDALFINFSNPESRIVLALNRYTKIKSLGLCHGIFEGREHAAKILGCDPAELDVLAAGLNHNQWMLHLRDKATGADLYPLLRERDASYDPAFVPFTRKLFRAFGLFPSPSDNHIGEYMPYGWQAGEQGYDFDDDERYRQFVTREIAALTAGASTEKDWYTPSGERGVAVVTGILHNEKRWIESGVVYNRGAIANLPADLAVEVPIFVDATGIHPLAVGELPAPIARLLTIQAGVQQMSVEAAVHGSKELAYQALLLDPVVNDMDAAWQMLNELWEINQSYIRACV